MGVSGVKKRSGFDLWILLLVVLVLAGCSREDSDGDRQEALQEHAAEVAAEKAAATTAPAPVTAVRAAPAWQEAAGAEYSGVFDEAIVLDGAQWEGQPYVEGGASAPRAGLAAHFLLTGDLDDDGSEEAVVLLWSSTGGSGTFDYLAVLGRDANGEVINRATQPLGDRVKVRHASIEGSLVVLDTVQAGPDDAACCPGQKMRRTFVLEGETLTETSTEDRGRLSLADLAGEWRLLRFGADEELPPDVTITVQFDDGRIAGSAACNRYTGGVQEGDAPGEVTLAGPLAMTRMMCPPPLMEWERRYSAALEGLAQYSFIAGRLVLGWRSGEESGTLEFVPAAEVETPGE